MADTLVQKDAPDFKAQALVGKGFKEIQLADYKGKWVVLYDCRESTRGHPHGIYMRTAAQPWGRWSSPQTIFNPKPNAKAKKSCNCASWKTRFIRYSTAS